MKHISFLIPALFVLTVSFGGSAQLTRNVLFIGNSYTGVNNLPQLVKDVALSAGDTLNFDSNTPGGYTLDDHASNTTTQSKIMAGGWDYVVLQGQSQEAIMQPYYFKTGAADLNNQIIQYSPCAITMFYITWGRKNGDAANCASFPDMCTYEGMDSTIRNAYLNLAATLDAEVSPVSVVWHYLRQNNPTIELYSPDESHPSSAGSYAAACTFYAAIFKKDPTNVTFDFGLNAADAATIRNAAKTVVYNNLTSWDFKEPVASEFWYESGTGTNELVFHASQPAETYYWDFGDGTNSSDPHIAHTYAGNGTYTVTFTTTICDLYGLHISTTDTVVQFCSFTPTVFTSNPWLCINDTLWTQPADSYEWFFAGQPIPETGQFVANYQQYGVSPFSVKTTIAGCSELSANYAEMPVWSQYYFDASGTPCNGDTVAFVVLHGSGSLTGTEIINWYKDGVPITASTNEDTLLITSDGVYLCKVIDPDADCPMDTSSFEIEFDCNMVGFPDPDHNQTWQLYPNPASETVTIDIVRPDSPLEVRNALGKLMFQTDALPHTVLDVSDFPPGIYYVNLQNSSYKALKFIKL